MIADGRTAIDTITIQSNFLPVQDINFDKFKTEGKHDNGTEKGKQYETYKVKNVRHGINDITVDMMQQVVTVRLSAKVLMKDYKRGITAHTLDRVVDAITSSGYIQFDCQQLYDNGRVLSVDTVDHVQLKDKYYQQLTAVPYSTMYDAVPYGRVQSSLVLKGRHSSVKYRQIHYDKIQDLNKDKKNREFLQICDARHMHKEFKNIVRIESNLTSFENIRKYLNIPENSLQKVLTAPGTPNLTLFNKIVGTVDIRVVELFTEYSEMSMQQELKIRGIQGIIRDFNYNWSLIERYIKTRAKTYYRNGLLKEVRKVYTQMQTTTDTDFVNIVDYVREQLQATA